jgi:hypothetical protein
MAEPATPPNEARLMPRALLAFLCLPGVVAYALPLTLALTGTRPFQHPILGGLLAGAGTLLLLSCVREF